MMFVEALNSLNVPASLAGSPASSSSDRMPKATVEAELPFFKPNYQFRRVATLWVPFWLTTHTEYYKLIRPQGHFLNNSSFLQRLSQMNW